jgi:SPP1 gp7 family putative phage head morphogenesis protein
MWDVANEAAIAWALRQATSLSREFQMNTTPRIQRLVADWIANSEPIGNLIDRVMGGYLYSEERARTIAVTETTRAFFQGNQMAWTASGVVQGKKFMTNRDELVCPRCGPLYGKTVLLNGQFETEDGTHDGPPIHVRCRCWCVPVV